MFLRTRLGIGQITQNTMTKKLIPVEKTTHCSRKESDGQAGSESKNEYADSSTNETTEKNRLSSNLVAQLSPHDTSCEFGQSECGSNHTSVDCDFVRIRGDFKVFNHVVNVREDGHERNWFTQSAAGYEIHQD